MYLLIADKFVMAYSIVLVYPMNVCARTTAFLKSVNTFDSIRGLNQVLAQARYPASYPSILHLLLLIIRMRMILTK